jgi:hypothetical protein
MFGRRFFWRLLIRQMGTFSLFVNPQSSSCLREQSSSSSSSFSILGRTAAGRVTRRRIQAGQKNAMRGKRKLKGGILIVSPAEKTAEDD